MDSRGTRGPMPSPPRASGPVLASPPAGKRRAVFPKRGGSGPQRRACWWRGARDPLPWHLGALGEDRGASRRKGFLWVGVGGREGFYLVGTRRGVVPGDSALLLAGRRQTKRHLCMAGPGERGAFHTEELGEGPGRRLRALGSQRDLERKSDMRTGGRLACPCLSHPCFAQLSPVLPGQK